MNIKPSTALNIFGGVLIVVGFAVLFVAANIRSTNATSRAQPPFSASGHTIEAPDETVTQGAPIRLNIPSVNIQNDVIYGEFDERHQKWTLTNDKVQYAAMTNPPNDARGITFMYGHNRSGVFARLLDIQEGASATVTTKEGQLFHYRFVERRTTRPEDTSIFEYDGSPILVLQTCTGLFYQNRELFTFALAGVDND